MDEKTEKAKKKMPMMEDDADDTDEQDTQETQPKKKTKKGIPFTASMARALARSAGYDIVPASVIKALQQVFAASKGSQILASGANWDSTWPLPESEDDEPAGKPFGTLEDARSVTGSAPNDQTPWKDPFEKTEKQMNEEPDVRLGQAFDDGDSANLDETTLGEAATRAMPGGTQVNLGTPVTKAEFDKTMKQVLDALSAVNAHLKDQNTRLSRVEVAKGISHIAADEEDAEHTLSKSNEDLWARTADGRVGAFNRNALDV